MFFIRRAVPHRSGKHQVFGRCRTCFPAILNSIFKHPESTGHGFIIEWCQEAPKPSHRKALQNQPPVWEAPTGSDDVPTGFQDTDQIVETEPTQVAESDVETCSPINPANSSSTPDGAETAAGSRSECDAWREDIFRKLEQGLTTNKSCWKNSASNCPRK